VAELIDNLFREDGEVRRSAAGALGDLGPRAQAAAPRLGSLLDDPDRLVASAAARALTKFGGASVAVLAEALKSPNREANKLVLESLRNLWDSAEPAVPALVEVVEHGDAELKKIALGVLTGIRTDSPEAVQAAIAAAADPSLRGAALSLLRVAGAAAEPSLPLLRRALGDEDPKVRVEAILAIGSVGKPAALAMPDLIRAYRVGTHAERSAILTALPRIDPSSEPAMELFVAALGDAEPELRAAGCAAISLVDAPPAGLAPTLIGL
jgi:HEAT repeat protein